MPLFFVSYKHNNLSNEFIQELRDRVNNYNGGFVLYIDKDNIAWSKGWRNEIDNAIDDSVGVIVLLTKGSVKSHWVTYEWARAMGKNKEVIPILLEDFDLQQEVDHDNSHPIAVHSQLQEIQYPDFFDPANRDWDRLLRDLERIAQEASIPNAIVVSEAALYNPATQDIAIRNLLDSDHPAAREALIRAMNDHFVESVKRHIAFNLAARGDEAAIPTLVDIVCKLKNADDAKRALQQLTKFQAKQAIPACEAVLLRGNLSDDYRWMAVRVTSARLLGQVGEEDELSFLLDMLKNESYYDVQAIAAQSIGEIASRIGNSNAEIAPVLIDKLYDLALRDLDPSTLQGLPNALAGSIGIVGSIADIETIIAKMDRKNRRWYSYGCQTIEEICSRQNSLKVCQYAIEQLRALYNKSTPPRRELGNSIAKIRNIRESIQAE